MFTTTNNIFIKISKENVIIFIIIIIVMMMMIIMTIKMKMMTFPFEIFVKNYCLINRMSLVFLLGS